MKRVLLATTALIVAGSSGAVFAADLGAPYRAPVPVAVYDWTGLYFGGHIGGGWEKTWSNDDSYNVIGHFGGIGLPVGAAASMNSSNSSFLGGVQAGWNYQIGRLVLGSEFDWSWTKFNTTATGGYPVFPGAGFTGGETLGSSNNWIGTATTRIGVARDNWLFYGKAGGAWTGANYTLGAIETAGAARATLGGTFSETRIGWTVGTGLEWAFAQNWTAKIEYDYLNFGSSAVTIPVGGITSGGVPYGGTVSANVNQSISEVKFGVNYKMGPGFLFW